jgi:hypothetical protein
MLASAVCNARPGDTTLRDATFLSCPSAHVQRRTRDAANVSRGANDPRNTDDTPMGFGGPSTFSATSSDLHQAYRTWLCCVLRLSQPLDASFRSKPSRLCFAPVTPLDFDLQRFSPAVSRHGLIDRDYPSCHSCDIAPSRPKSTARSATRGSRELSTRRIRTDQHHGFPGTSGRSSPDSSPLRGIFPRYSAPCFHRTSSHGLCTRPDGEPPDFVHALQSLKEPKVGRSPRRSSGPP